MNRREFIKKQGVGEFLLYYYPDAVRRVFGQGVTNPSTIEQGIKHMLINWVQAGNSLPKLPQTVLDILGLTQTQSKITNFLGTP